MTLLTWKAEFYSTLARDCSAEDAIKHSLRKWEGMRETNLNKHGIETSAVTSHLYEIGKPCSTDFVFRVDDSSCALCHHFSPNDMICRDCPLQTVRGAACDRPRSDETHSPWSAWQDDGGDRDPEPMIFWLTKALEAQTETA